MAASRGPGYSASIFRAISGSAIMTTWYCLSIILGFAYLLLPTGGKTKR